MKTQSKLKISNLFSTKNISKVHFENTIRITNEESLALKSIQKWTKNN